MKETAVHEVPPRLATARRIAGELEREGLTPFDLCSWTTLLYLTDRCGDLDVTHGVREATEDAVHRKAADLDALHASDFHRAIVGDRR